MMSSVPLTLSLFPKLLGPAGTIGYYTYLYVIYRTHGRSSYTTRDKGYLCTL